MYIFLWLMCWWFSFILPVLLTLVQLVFRQVEVLPSQERRQSVICYLKCHKTYQGIDLRLYSAAQLGNQATDTMKRIIGWLLEFYILAASKATPLQHLRSYKYRYHLVTVHSHGIFVVLPHWEIRPLALWINGWLLEFYILATSMVT